MMPTLPINMAVQSNILDALQRSGVIPSDDPTVNRAEQLSKSSAFVGSSGSSDIRISEYIRYETIDNATTAFARRIEPMAMERLNAVTYSRPVTIDLRLSHIAAMVLTLIPPAVDWDPPPIHIRNKMNKIVTSRKPAGLSDEKPALRGVTELNMDCTILSDIVMPASE